MAGPAIRVWEMATLLSERHAVKVVTFGSADRTSERFLLRKTTVEQCEIEVGAPDIVIVQGYLLQTFPWLGQRDFRLVVDLYDPLHIESLEVEKDRSISDRRVAFANAQQELRAQMRVGDFFLCASDRQRNMSLGALCENGRITPDTYDADPTARALIDIAPFGLSSSTPHQQRHAIKGAIPGISETDSVIVWGGGIYNWFDPCTVIRAIDQVKDTTPEVRLVFLGARHPNPDVPAMRMVGEARALSDELNLTGSYVFFNESWVDYSDRHNFLLDADLGISAHFDSIETTFSFRTRMLDYLWTGLPIVTTEGDYFADLVRREGLGSVVPYGDPGAMAETIVSMLGDPQEMVEVRSRVQRVSKQFQWSKTLRPLIEYCDDPWFAADRPHGQRESARPATTPPRQSFRGLARKSYESIRAQGVRSTLRHIQVYLAKGRMK